MNHKNKGLRNAYIESKSFNRGLGRKGYAKRYVSKARRRGGKALCRQEG